MLDILNWVKESNFWIVLVTISSMLSIITSVTNNFKPLFKFGEKKVEENQTKYEERLIGLVKEAFQGEFDAINKGRGDDAVYLHERLREIEDKINNLDESMGKYRAAYSVIVKDQLNERLKTHINAKYCSYDDRQVIETMYDTYNKLGGNGFLKLAYEKVKQLPYEKPQRGRPKKVKEENAGE